MKKAPLKWLGFWLLLSLGATAHGDFGELSSIASGLGFKPEDEQKLLAGEIISADLPETTEKMLAQSFAIYAPIHTYKIADLVLSERVFQADTNVLASGRIDPKNIAKSLAKASFNNKETDELNTLKGFVGGDDFNLSDTELAQLGKAVKAGQTNAKALSKVYRAILVGRMQAYLKSGIAGIAPYQRDSGKQSSAADDLLAMTKASTLLATGAPGLYRSFLDYPNNQSSHLEHGFFWVKRKVQERPTFVLEHRILEHSPAGGLTIMRREFFVGHSYNAAQAISGAYTISNKGTLLFSTIRSASDQVQGAMGSVRHAIARKLMTDELTLRFKNLRKLFAK